MTPYTKEDEEHQRKHYRADHGGQLRAKSPPTKAHDRATKHQMRQELKKELDSEVKESIVEE
jgi:hypothetical protein|tara:strand:- start:493 stop:678 length:186 start_codon:yes stop_codon:yes gene_type:complete